MAYIGGAERNYAKAERNYAKAERNYAKGGTQLRQRRNATSPKKPALGGLGGSVLLGLLLAGEP